MVLFQKQLRSSKTEFVNALLHISYHKNIILSEPFPGHCLQKRFLHQIAVLIFIYQNLFKLTAQFVCCLCIDHPAFFPANQNLQSLMLQVIKIHQISVSFFLLKTPVKILCQI